MIHAGKAFVNPSNKELNAWYQDCCIIKENWDQATEKKPNVTVIKRFSTWINLIKLIADVQRKFLMLSEI